MRLRIKALLIAVLAMATVAGCNPPSEISPVAPPGFEEYTRTPAIPADQAAQALGEQGSTGPSPKQNTVKTTTGVCPPTPIGKPTTTPSGLTYETLKEGTGATAQPGQIVSLHYTGTLADGTVFDSSRLKNEPFVIPIGVGRVIGGWDEGVPGMKEGERRKLTIPPALGYGPAGSPPKIPGNAVLTFDVELIQVK
jgi:FKBP-type peptidyl-prolyl cis-trans isomerase